MGSVSNLRMTEAHKFTSLRVTPSDKTNGVKTNYRIDYSSGVPTEDGDKLYIKFPKTIRTPMTPNCRVPDFEQCAVNVNCDTESGKIVATITTKLLNGNKKCTKGKITDQPYVFFIQDVENAGSFITS